MKTIICKLCKYKHTSELVKFNTTRYCKVPIKFNLKTRLVMCEKCGFVHSDIRNQKIYSEIYKKAPFYDFKKYTHYDVFKRVKLYNKYFKLSKAKVLEIGGGDTRILRSLLKKKNVFTIIKI